jgi:predicted PurR-regulated permease PerM
MSNSPTKDTRTTEAVTPIYISARTRRVLVAAGLAVLLLLVWRTPMLLVLTLGGGALALVLSFPVRRLTRVLPRGAAIALSLLLVAALVVAALAIVAPIVLSQLRALVDATPEIAGRLGARVPPALDGLASRGLLPSSPEDFLEETRQRLLVAAQAFVGRLLGGMGRFVAGVAGVAATVVGIVFVAVYLLADGRRMQAALLRATPHRYRRDVHVLSDAFTETLSRYLGGVAIAVTTEGALAALAFHVLGIQYAFLLGAWVGLMALVPYIGALAGYAPATLIALAISPQRAMLTVLLSFTINMLEGNVINPRIQGRAVHVHPLLVFLAAVAGGALFGVPGVVLATPAMAVARVLYDFLRPRLRVEEVERPPAAHPAVRSAS